MSSSAESGRLESVDPSTGEVVFDAPAHSADDLDTLLEEAHTTQRHWRRVPVAERSRAIQTFADELAGHRAELAELVSVEMGKPIGEAETEIDKSIGACRVYAELGPGWIAPEEVETGFERASVRFDPLGVILAIMPWNFPVWQVVRMVAPALLAGNTVVLKHASNVSQCALMLQRVAAAAGLGDGRFAAVLCRSGAVAPLIADKRIAAVCITGSSAVGAEVASVAGRHLKPQVLELGGSDAFLVLDDADVEAAAVAAVQARFLNAGQSCVAAKRFVVADSVFEDFVEGFVAGAEALTLGNPRDRATRLGPLARRDLRDDLAQQVTGSVRLGARCLTGGQPVDGPGNFYRPTVLVDVDPSMPVIAEETFGPAAPVMRVRDDEEAIAVANASQFGLGASVWTSDPARADAIAAQLDVGSVFVNGRVSSDARLPFGGVKQSGYGRELGEFGIRALTNVKTVAFTALRPRAVAAVESRDAAPVGGERA
jgi:succinate-semialdehyde dehydrogenase / glutarate-semialdehyde dehydrogenase